MRLKRSSSFRSRYCWTPSRRGGKSSIRGDSGGNTGCGLIPSISSGARRRRSCIIWPGNCGALRGNSAARVAVRGVPGVAADGAIGWPAARVGDRRDRGGGGDGGVAVGVVVRGSRSSRCCLCAGPAGRWADRARARGTKFARARGTKFGRARGTKFARARGTRFTWSGPAAGWRSEMTRAPAFLSEPALAALLEVLPEARVVGGAVRDTLLGRTFADIDLASPLPPETVMERL